MARFHKHRSVTEKILGVILIILGIFSTVIPGIPGFVLVLLGLTLMGERRIHIYWQEKLKPWIQKKREARKASVTSTSSPQKPHKTSGRKTHKGSARPPTR